MRRQSTLTQMVFGRIYDVITGKDGTIRGTKLFVGKTKKTVERLINKL